MKSKVYAFDFDGTLTTRDTFLAFIRFVYGEGKFLRGIMLYSPILILLRLKLFPNWKAKQMVFSHFFKGMSIDEFNNHCRQFAAKHSNILRTKGVEKIREALAEGSRVIIVSASIENWVRPFFDEFDGQIRIACTKIDVRHDTITGKFLTMNCYGQEKVKRIERAFPLRDTYELIVYGDSQGDKEMLAYADHGYYKPFR